MSNIELNKKMFGRRIKQLQVMIEDESFIPNGSTNSYHEFILSMYKALVNGIRLHQRWNQLLLRLLSHTLKI